jgi:hypothetical protein
MNGRPFDRVVHLWSIGGVRLAFILNVGVALHWVCHEYGLFEADLIPNHLVEWSESPICLQTQPLSPSYLD